MKWLSLCALVLLPTLTHALRAETVLGTAITAVPATISKPGVYHFTRNLDFTPATGSAITITTGDVVLDFNGHELLNITGTNNNAAAVACVNQDRITIQNGTIRGFKSALVLIGNDLNVNGLTLTGIFANGILVTGNHAQITGNRVYSIGGAGASSVVSALGISLTGTYGLIRDNDVQQVVETDGSGLSAAGIRLKGCSNIIVSDNRISDVEPINPATASSAGIATVAPCDTIIFLGNTVTTAHFGFDFTGVSAGGKYTNNVTGNVGTPYATSAGETDAGNNN